MKMATSTSKFLFLFLLSILIVCSSFLFISSLKKQVKQEKEQESVVVFHSSHRELQNIDPPITNFPTTPVTNPVTTPVTNPVTTPSTGSTVPPDTPTPTVVTIPSANPSPINLPPATPTTTNPINPPMPITNPVTTPSTNIPGGQPVTNPATTPVVGPPATTTNPPPISGQSWCVAKSGVPETTIQSALDYACGIGGADCASIQQGAGCYNPNTLQNHASYAFNSYYQKNPGPTSCDFGGAAALTNTNPSSGSCIYSTSSTSGSPVNPTPTTASSSGASPTGLGTPPDVLNAGNPGLGGGTSGFGDISPTANGSSASISSGLQPFIGCIIVGTSFIIGNIVLDI